jgi:hypothetical protein
MISSKSLRQVQINRPELSYAMMLIERKSDLCHLSKIQGELRKVRTISEGVVAFVKPVDDRKRIVQG